MTVPVLRYNYKLRPGAQAESVLMAEWHRVRWVWNQCGEERKRGRFMTSQDLTRARASIEWLREGSVAAQQVTVREFSGKGRRSMKSKRDRPSIGYAGWGNGFGIRDGRLRVKGALIPVVWHRELPSAPSSVRVFRDPLGHWYASFVVEVEDETLPPSGGRVGIDWGVAQAATATDSRFDFDSPGHARAAQKKLTRYQRMMSRRAPARGKTGSRGYKKAKRQVARAHRKVKRQRAHDAHQWANRVVRENDLVAVEDFKPRFLAKSTMARKAADNGVGILKRVLIEKAERAGREVVLVPPAYTTMTCSNCGERQARLGLSERTFRCADCGFVLHRDRNAARVILATAERNRAGAKTVRHSDLLSVGMQVEPESSRL